MFHSILAEISWAKFVAAVFFTGVTLGARWAYKKITDEAVYLYRKERKQIIRKHVAENHGGHPLDCDDSACISLLVPAETALLEGL